MNTGNQNYGHLYGISSFLFLFSGSCFVTVFSGNAGYNQVVRNGRIEKSDCPMGGLFKPRRVGCAPHNGRVLPQSVFQVCA
jgi:hypothetical protein